MAIAIKANTVATLMISRIRKTRLVRLASLFKRAMVTERCTNSRTINRVTNSIFVRNHIVAKT